MRLEWNGRTQEGSEDKAGKTLPGADDGQIQISFQVGTRAWCICVSSYSALSPGEETMWAQNHLLLVHATFRMVSPLFLVSSHAHQDRNSLCGASCLSLHLHVGSGNQKIIVRLGGKRLSHWTICQTRQCWRCCLLVSKLFSCCDRGMFLVFKK